LAKYTGPSIKYARGKGSRHGRLKLSEKVSLSLVPDHVVVAWMPSIKGEKASITGERYYETNPEFVPPGEHIALENAGKGRRPAHKRKEHVFFTTLIRTPEDRLPATKNKAGSNVSGAYMPVTTWNSK
jgi:hypothetical protein